MEHQDSSSPEDSTQEQAQEQLDLAGKQSKRLNSIIARAIRAQANGDDVPPETREALAQGYQALLDLLPKPDEQESSTNTLEGTPLDLMAAYWDLQAQRKEMAATGFSSLNTALSGGLERDRLYILMGAPGSGKTTLANQMIDHMGRERAVLYVTSEDAPMAMLAKTIARRGLIDYSAVLRGYPGERDRIDAAFAEYREQPQAARIRYVDATQGLGLQKIAEQADAHFEALRGETEGDPIIVVDYLQRLVRADGVSVGADARQAATAYTERLRALACDLHCSVICLSAMSRASGYNHTSSNLLSAAKESGDIEYTADVILAIGPQLEDGMPVSLPDPGSFAWNVTIAKNRQGMSSATGAHIDLMWRPRFQQFIEREYTPGQEEAETDSASKNGKSRYAGRKK